MTPNTIKTANLNGGHVGKTALIGKCAGNAKLAKKQFDLLVIGDLDGLVGIALENVKYIHIARMPNRY